MKLTVERGLRLFRAVKACELRLRNWSTPDEWVFAIYEIDDTYVGCVRLHDDGELRIHEGTYKNARKERVRLEGLCREHARLAP